MRWKRTNLHCGGEVHVAAIVFVVLYGLLVISFILFYDSAHFEVLLHLEWAALVVGIIFLFLASRSRRKVHLPREKVKPKKLVSKVECMRLFAILNS